MACVSHSLAACQQHRPSSPVAVIGLSNNDVISLRSLRCMRCVGWKPRLNPDKSEVIIVGTPHQLSLAGNITLQATWLAASCQSRTS